jgi:hypothetical protein
VAIVFDPLLQGMPGGVIFMIYVLIYALNVADLILTHYAVNVMQIAEEANPLMAPIVGSWVIVPVKLTAALLVVAAFYRLRRLKMARAATWFVLVLYILVVFNNSVTILAELF